MRISNASFNEAPAPSGANVLLSELHLFYSLFDDDKTADVEIIQSDLQKRAEWAVKNA